MRYLLLIYVDPKAYENVPQAEQDAMYQEYFEITDALVKAGVHQGGNPLQAVTTATTVRVRNGKALTTDGPFAETKEHLVGYYLVECKNLDQALEYAAKIPDARFGSIEVRPIMEVPAPA